MSAATLQQRLQLFPVSARVHSECHPSSLSIANCDLQQLALEFGTPLYLYDQATLQAAVQDYRRALSQYYPAESGLTYAGKAFLCTAFAQWSQRQKLLLDCTGANELAVAAQAGLKPGEILVHGVNKSEEDLQAACLQAGIIVADNLIELQRIIQLARSGISRIPELWLRLRPGLATDTHQHTQTGQADSKFGMSPEEIHIAVSQCLANNLPLTGMHFHQGSHFHDPAPIAPAIEVVLDLIVHLRKQFNWLPDVISPGGGWGVPYHEDDLPHPTIKNYVQFVCEHIVRGCRQCDLPLPRLQLEPGRSLVARAGVALYRVGSVKQSAHIRWLLIDGGLADNPRPALYGARYSALPVNRPERQLQTPTWIAGPYCESGDILIKDLDMPEIQAGELIAVPVSGAYQLSMASNYNGACKPAVLWLQDGQTHLIQERESKESLYRRDRSLPA
ncbi:MAG TPA: diaminopimelate decarboxylase [Anaerolineales bacterium]|nr:diaminopimelate decarboxylase [Anaerolineales bacterium]